MDEKNIEPYWNKNHTKYAILVTKGMHTGWTVMNVPEVAYDKRIVEYVIEHLKIPGWQQSFQYNRRGAEGQLLAIGEDNPAAKELDDFLCSIGYEDMYLNPMAYVNVVWIDAGRKWHIRDGGECQDNLEFEDEQTWISFA